MKHVTEINKITEAKHNRAQHVMSSRSSRKTLLNLKEMTKFLKALRVKADVLKQNLAYLNGKKACQKWFMRTQVTLMLRRRNEQVIERYNQTKLQKCLAAMKKHLALERRGIKKFE